MSNSIPPAPHNDAPQPTSLKQRLRGGAVAFLGFMLSPLSWWNDLFFNLPIAYGFGWLCRLINPAWLWPGTVVGYWLSNVLGMILLYWGGEDALGRSAPNLRRSIGIGVLSSTAYTLVVVVLIQFRVLDLTAVLPTF